MQGFESPAAVENPEIRDFVQTHTAQGMLELMECALQLYPEARQFIPTLQKQRKSNNSLN